MMKKLFIIIGLFFILISSVSCVAMLRHPEPENVFDFIYYQVEDVKKGEKNVLVNGTESAYADYDFGDFQNIQIPELDMSITIRDDSLHFLFNNHKEGVNWNTSHIIHFRYDLNDKKLYGERDFEYLTENFLSHYFEWFDNDDKAYQYSLDNLGNYTFTEQENVYWTDLKIE